MIGIGIHAIFQIPGVEGLVPLAEFGLGAAVLHGFVNVAGEAQYEREQHCDDTHDHAEFDHGDARAP